VTSNVFVPESGGKQYALPPREVVIYIVTEQDRHITTVLLPDEY
jgi:hypothetical protein